jgi:tetratricopeptide (TPR) repeat protein
MEKFLAYQALKSKEPMEKIARAGNPLLFSPAYEYALGNFEKSIEAFHKISENYVPPNTHLASSYFKAGRIQQSDSIINLLIKNERDQPGVSFQLALTYAARGDKKKTLEWYTKAYARRDIYILFTRVCPDLEIIMNEPEVKNILKEIGI